MRAAPAVLSFALFGVLVGSAMAMPPAPERPAHIVLIVSDDHGWPDYGFLGSRLVKTPHLDALARSGTTFENGFSTASVCRPALQTLLYGHPLESGHVAETRNAPADQRPESLPRRLAPQGYASFQGGKHWEGTFADAGFTGGTARTAARGLKIDGSDFGWENLDPLWAFLDASDREKTFLWFAPMLPHVRHDPGPERQARFEDAGIHPLAARYYANVELLDQRVGELLAGLDERGLRDQTLVVFLADNGWDQRPNEEPPWNNVLGHERGKTSIYELGFRTPILFSWPGRIPAGVRREDLISFEDVFATILDFAGAPRPADTGHSLRARLRGAGAPVRDELVASMRFLRAPAAEVRKGAPGLRTERAHFYRDREWSYVWFEDRGEDELYRIREDPLQQHDVIERHRDRVPAFRERIRASPRYRDAPAASPVTPEPTAEAPRRPPD